MTASASSPPKIDRPLNVIVATDCGSTTTKAILIEKSVMNIDRPIAVKPRRRWRRRLRM